MGVKCWLELIGKPRDSELARETSLPDGGLSDDLFARLTVVVALPKGLLHGIYRRYWPRVGEANELQ